MHSFLNRYIIFLRLCQLGDLSQLFLRYVLDLEERPCASDKTVVVTKPNTERKRLPRRNFVEFPGAYWCLSECNEQCILVEVIPTTYSIQYHSSTLSGNTTGRRKMHN
jgi:hypothetical protein